MPFIIVSPRQHDTHVINADGSRAEFATRKAARAHADNVVIPVTPSKYLPLRVREVEA